MRAVKMLPRCIRPEGEGAKRPLRGDGVFIIDKITKKG